MNKRAQFFLIAALLISGIAIGFSTLYNTAYIERADTQVYDLSEELYSELQQTYDAGTVRGDKPEEIQANLKKLSEYYQLQNPDSTFVIFYGNANDPQGVQRLDTSGSDIIYEESGATLGASSANARGVQSDNSGRDTQPSEIKQKKKVKIRLRFKDTTSQQPQTSAQSPDQQPAEQHERVIESPTFELKPGQNFYFVIRKKVKNEQVVVYRK